MKQLTTQEEYKAIGKNICEGFILGLKAAERESVSNNSLKMSGKPMKRKQNPKDKRGKMRKSILRIKRFGERLKGESNEALAGDDTSRDQ